jgi:hypothetical protein
VLRRLFLLFGWPIPVTSFITTLSNVRGARTSVGGLRAWHGWRQPYLRRSLHPSIEALADAVNQLVYNSRLYLLAISISAPRIVEVECV